MPHLPEYHPISMLRSRMTKTRTRLESIELKNLPEWNIPEDQKAELIYHLRFLDRRVSSMESILDRLEKDRDRLRRAFKQKCFDYQMLRLRHEQLCVELGALRTEVARLRAESVAPPPPMPEVSCA